MLNKDFESDNSRKRRKERNIREAQHKDRNTKGNIGGTGSDDQVKDAKRHLLKKEKESVKEIIKEELRGMKGPEPLATSEVFRKDLADKAAMDYWSVHKDEEHGEKEGMTLFENQAQSEIAAQKSELEQKRASDALRGRRRARHVA